MSKVPARGRACEAAGAEAHLDLWRVAAAD